MQECARPEVKEVKSTLGATILRLGDTEENREESIEITVRTSKATAIARPPSMKKFARLEGPQTGDSMEWEDESGHRAIQYAPVKSRTDHFIKEEGPATSPNGSPKKLEDVPEVKVELDDDGEPITNGTLTEPQDPSSIRQIPEENTVSAYKYGSTYIPVEKADFEQLKTEKGLDLLGFIPLKKVIYPYSEH